MAFSKAKKTLNTIKRNVQKVPKNVRRKVGTKLVKAAVGKKKAKKIISTARNVRRATGMKFV